MCGRAGRPGEPRPVFARAGSRPKRAMLPGRGGRVELGPRVRPGTVSRPKRSMLPGRGGRVDLSRRSPGASARAPCESVSPARGCPLAAWQTVSPRPRLRGRSSRLVTGRERAGRSRPTGRSGKLRPVPERRGPERVPGRRNHTFQLHHPQRVKSIYRWRGSAGHASRGRPSRPVPGQECAGGQVGLECVSRW